MSKKVVLYTDKGVKYIVKYKKKHNDVDIKNYKVKLESNLAKNIRHAKNNTVDYFANLPSTTAYKIKDKRIVKKQNKLIKKYNSMPAKAIRAGKNIANTTATSAVQLKNSAVNAYRKGKNIVKSIPSLPKRIADGTVKKQIKEVPSNVKNKIKTAAKNSKAYKKAHKFKNITKNHINKIKQAKQNLVNKAKSFPSKVKNLPTNIKNKIKDSKRSIKTKLNNTLPAKAYYKGKNVVNKTKANINKIKDGIKKYNPKAVAGRTRKNFNSFMNDLNRKSTDGKAHRMKNLANIVGKNKKLNNAINTAKDRIKNSNIYKKLEKLMKILNKLKWPILITTCLCILAYTFIPMGIAVAQSFGSTTHYYCDMTAPEDVMKSEIWQRYCGSKEGNSNETIADAALSMAYDPTNKNATLNVTIKHSDGKSHNMPFLATKVYAMVHDNVNPGCSYADCGKCAATAVRWAGADDNYPASGTSGQLHYLERMSRTTTKWLFVGTTETPALLEPGDVLLVGPSTGGNFSYGHTAIYVGSEKIQEKFPGTNPDFEVVSGSLRSYTPKLVKLKGEYTGGSKHGYYFIFRNLEPDSAVSGYNGYGMYDPSNDPKGCKWPPA